MSTIPSVDTHSAQLPFVTAHRSLWNTRTVVVLAGVVLVVELAFAALLYLLFIDRKTSNQPSLPQTDLSKRLIHDLFPEAANGKQSLPFSQHAAGIIRINSKDIPSTPFDPPIDTLSLRCSYQNAIFFCQPMTRVSSSSDDFFEVFIPEMPLNQKIKMEFIHEANIYLTRDMLVNKEMAIYSVYKSCLFFYPKPFPKLEEPLHDMAQQNADDLLSITILSTGKLQWTNPRPVHRENYQLIENRSSKIHILFFEIAGRLPINLRQQMQLVVSIVVGPKETKKLPQEFLCRCWEEAYETTHHTAPPKDPNLEIFSMGNTTA